MKIAHFRIHYYEELRTQRKMSRELATWNALGRITALSLVDLYLVNVAYVDVELSGVPIFQVIPWFCDWSSNDILLEDIRSQNLALTFRAKLRFVVVFGSLLIVVAVLIVAFSLIAIIIGHRLLGVTKGLYVSLLACTNQLICEQQNGKRYTPPNFLLLWFWIQLIDRIEARIFTELRCWQA